MPHKRFECQETVKQAYNSKNVLYTMRTMQHLYRTALDGTDTVHAVHGTDGTRHMTQILDATGYSCPIPVLKARKALRDMAAGDQITVRATDPASYIDIPHFCNTAGHDLIHNSEDNGVYTYIIRKKQA